MLRIIQRKTSGAEYAYLAYLALAFDSTRPMNSAAFSRQMRIWGKEEEFSRMGRFPDSTETTASAVALTFRIHLALRI